MDRVHPDVHGAADTADPRAPAADESRTTLTDDDTATHGPPERRAASGAGDASDVALAATAVGSLPGMGAGDASAAAGPGAGPGAGIEGDDALIGTTVGRYRVLARLGAGGMGVVYRALDPVLDRTVALKVLPPLDEPRRTVLESRLRREAQALARLDHPNALAVYDVGIARASLFVAMQFVDGTTLDHAIAEPALPPRRILALYVAAGRGLAAAHAAGIVHRDVKPSNILVDRAGRACIGDFGLAHGEGDADPPSADLPLARLGAGITRAGSIVGTPLYMSPEQHRGEPTTARSDQFSFCVAVWRDVFGGHPFAAGRWNRRAALAAMERDRIAEPRDPPRRLRLPARAVRGLRRGLRHDPAARWPSMTALIAELDPPRRSVWLAGGLVGAGGIGGGVIAALLAGGPAATPRRPRR